MRMFDKLFGKKKRVEEPTAEELSRQIYVAIFPHIARVWNEIRLKLADRQFTYDDLRSIGIWEEEASTSLYYLSEVWGRVEVVGLRTFRIRSVAPIDEHCPPGVSLGGQVTVGFHIINLKVHNRYKGRLDEVIQGFLRAVFSMYGSLLEPEPNVSPHGDRIDFIFTTKPAPLSEIKGFADWTNLKSREYGVPPSSKHPPARVL